jgi:hypothetical protein
MIAAGLCFVAFLLFQIFPLLVIIPIPFIFFLGILALPLKKDQPMETYLSAVVDFYLKPQKRIWMPGQSDTTIVITAPKNVEENRTKDLSQEEAGRRLSFLANIVDTEGYAIKETNSNLRDDVASEAAQAQDIFEANQNYALDHTLEQNTANRHAQLVEQMRNAINQNSIYGSAAPQQTPQITHQTPVQSMATPQTAVQPVQPVQPLSQPSYQPITPQTPQFQAPVIPTTPNIVTTPASTTTATPVGTPVNISASAATIQPDMEEIHEALTKPSSEPESIPEPISEPIPTAPTPPPVAPEPTPEPEPSEEMKNLANNTDFSIETIAKQANRIREKQTNDNEVYISLH